MHYYRENVSGYVQSTKREGVGRGDTAGRAYGIESRRSGETRLDPALIFPALKGTLWQRI